MAYKKNQINLRMSEKNSTFAGLFCAMCACTRENEEGYWLWAMGVG